MKDLVGFLKDNDVIEYPDYEEFYEEEEYSDEDDLDDEDYDDLD